MRSLQVMLFTALALGAVPASAQGAAAAAPAGNPLAAAPHDGLTLELEAGAFALSRNDVRIPNDGGTRFDLRDLTGSGPAAYGRVALTWRFADRHALRLTAAPLRISGSGELAQDVDFEGSTFPAGVPTRGSYQFSNYRLTYRRMFSPGEHWHWGIGGTVFVRDAAIRLRQGSLRETNDDVGLVPLLHVYGERRLGERDLLVIDVEAAAAPQGRAVDATIRVQRRLRNGMTLGVGYRGLEGGADNDTVYTFAWLHYLALSASWQLR